MRRHLLIAAIVGSSCLDPTQVTLVLTTNEPCDKLGSITIAVAPRDQVETADPMATANGCDPSTQRIGTVVVVPRENRVAAFGVRVVAGVGRAAESCLPPAYGSGCIVARRSVGFLEHTPLTLPIDLSSACDGIACTPDQTCADGQCVSSTVDPGSCQGVGCPIHGDAGPDATAPPASSCGDMSGLQAGAPWPMVGYCPKHTFRSPYSGPSSAATFLPIWTIDINASLATTGLTFGGAVLANDGHLYVAASPASGAGKAQVIVVDTVGSNKQPGAMFVVQPWPEANVALGSPTLARDGLVYFGDGNGLLGGVDSLGMRKWSVSAGGGRLDGSGGVISGGDVIYLAPQNGPLKGFSTTSHLGVFTASVNPAFDESLALDEANSELALGLGAGLVGVTSTSSALTTKYTYGVTYSPEFPVTISSDGATVYSLARNGTTAGPLAIAATGTVTTWGPVDLAVPPGDVRPRAGTALSADGKSLFTCAGALYRVDAQAGTSSIALNGFPCATAPIVGADGTVYVGAQSGKDSVVIALGASLPSKGYATVHTGVVDPSIAALAIGPDGVLYVASGGILAALK